MILWVITPTDIMNAGSKENADSANTGALREDLQSSTVSAKSRSFWDKIEASITKGTFGERLNSRWEDTRTSIVLKHLLIASESQNQYIASYLKNGDNANFLKSEPDAKWQMQLQSFDTELVEIVGQAKNAGVPLVAVFVPNRPQAAMLSNGDWPAGYDPFKVKDEVRDSIVSHGGLFIDILPNYRLVPNP
jgi:hypothetical protein